MILLYTFLLLFLGALKMLIDRRVRALEKKYARTAKAADDLVRELSFKGGNSAKSDACQTAKRQYLLGLLVQKRDRQENRYAAAQGLSEKLDRLVTGLRNWKGKKLPYTLGALDVACVLGLIDYLGVAHYVSLRNVIQVIASHLAK
jgi:hypothetical protein